jgi:hypothetical protein
MDAVIPEIKEKMWEEVDIFGQNGMVLAKANDYKLIELLSDYYELFNDEEKDEEVYTKYINRKISECRGINNEIPYHTPIY